MVWEDLKPRDILDRGSFDNAITTVLALGGSTNALVHLIAMARRAGIPLTIDRFDELSRRTPLLANVRPAGEVPDGGFLSTRAACARCCRAIGDLLALDARTVDGTTLGEDIAGAEVFNDDVILPRERRARRLGQPRRAARQPRARWRGDQARGGRSATAAASRARQSCSPITTTWRRASTIRRCRSRADSVLVLQHAGPLGAPGMPEWGQLPIPKKLLEQGVRDMVRISDARMSGTSYGACVLHVAPESYRRRPAGAGARRRHDRARRRRRGSLQLDVDDAELARRRAAWRKPAPHFARGFGALYQNHITQANDGCDFDFLEGTAPTPEPEIH